MIIKDLKDCGKETQRRLKELEAAGVSDTAKIDFLRRKAAALRLMRQRLTRIVSRLFPAPRVYILRQPQTAKRLSAYLPITQPYSVRVLIPHRLSAAI